MWMGGEMEMKQPGVSGNVAGKEGETDCHNTVKISDQRNLEFNVRSKLQIHHDILNLYLEYFSMSNTYTVILKVF